jgi:hypothetical protein
VEGQRVRDNSALEHEKKQLYVCGRVGAKRFRPKAPTASKRLSANTGPKAEPPTAATAAKEDEPDEEDNASASEHDDGVGVDGRVPGLLDELAQAALHGVFARLKAASRNLDGEFVGAEAPLPHEQQVVVLVEGDDMNEPVADAVRGILDGHIVLSRALAHFNHYPAIDVLESVSRLTRDVCTPEEVVLAGRAREQLALYRKNEDLISIGAYTKGANPALDQAVTLHEPLKRFLRQSVSEHMSRTQTFQTLKSLLP